MTLSVQVGVEMVGEEVEVEEMAVEEEGVVAVMEVDANYSFLCKYYLHCLLCCVLRS